MGDSASAQSGTNYDLGEGEGAWASCYLNLKSGANADETRPYLPHIGRLGQLAVLAGWQRDLSNGLFGYIYSNAYRISAAAPISPDLALAFQFAQTNYSTGEVPMRAYTLTLTWALGSPDSRLGN